ncbi:MAG: RNA polymerase sigma-70 factor (ECF subfamily) [Alphaproteobacteria bacterium]|jgi:RNA polymerase sigma-70 factor (ECF subfamily)
MSQQAIGKAMLLGVANTKKRITIATQALEDHAFETSFDNIPRHAKTNLRQILCLLFNNGLNCKEEHADTIPIACIEALNLMRVVANNAILNAPESSPLLALINLYMTRIHTRFDNSGTPIPLNYQDRKNWKTPYLVEGCYLLNQALDSHETHATPYLYEALLAQEHIKADCFDTTHWDHIISH